MAWYIFLFLLLSLEKILEDSHAVFFIKYVLVHKL
jgi:hypothetical protein